MKSKYIKADDLDQIPTAPAMGRKAATRQANEPEAERPKPGPRPKPNNLPSREKGTKPGEIRTTTILMKEDVIALKRIAYWDRRSFKDVLTEFIQAGVKAYEKKHGTLKPGPDRVEKLYREE